MDPLSEFEAQYARSAQLYGAIGRFVVQFEWLCDALRSQICELAWEDPTAPSTPVYIVLGDVPASGLVPRLQALLARESDLYESDRPIIENVCKRITHLIETRNQVVHGLWFMDLPRVDGRIIQAQRKHRKSGPHVASWQRTSEDIELLADEAEALSGFLAQMHWALDEGIQMSEHAVWDSNGHVKIVWADPTP